MRARTWILRARPVTVVETYQGFRAPIYSDDVTGFVVAVVHFSLFPTLIQYSEYSTVLIFSPRSLGTKCAASAPRTKAVGLAVYRTVTGSRYRYRSKYGSLNLGRRTYPGMYWSTWYVVSGTRQHDLFLQNDLWATVQIVYRQRVT